MRTEHFEKIYWFVVGVCAFGAFLSIYAIHVDKANTPIVLTFWLSTGVASCIGYLVGSSISKAKGSDPVPGTTNIELSATTTTENNKENL